MTRIFGPSRQFLTENSFLTFIWSTFSESVRVRTYTHAARYCVRTSYECRLKYLANPNNSKMSLFLMHIFGPRRKFLMENSFLTLIWSIFSANVRVRTYTHAARSCVRTSYECRLKYLANPNNSKMSVPIRKHECKICYGASTDQTWEAQSAMPS